MDSEICVNYENGEMSGYDESSVMSVMTEIMSRYSLFF